MKRIIEQIKKKRKIIIAITLLIIILTSLKPAPKVSVVPIIYSGWPAFDGQPVIPISFVMDYHFYDRKYALNKIIESNQAVLRGIYEGQEKDFLFDMTSGIISNYDGAKEKIVFEILMDGEWVEPEFEEGSTYSDIPIFDGEFRLKSSANETVFQSSIYNSVKRDITVRIQVSRNQQYCYISFANLDLDNQKDMDKSGDRDFVVNLHTGEILNLPKQVTENGFSLTENNDILTFRDSTSDSYYIYHISKEEMEALPRHIDPHQLIYSPNATKFYTRNSSYHYGNTYEIATIPSKIFHETGSNIVAFDNGMLLFGFGRPNMYPIFQTHNIMKISPNGRKTVYTGSLPSQAVWNPEGEFAYYVRDGKIYKFVLS